MSLLPANAAARRREEEARDRARTEAFDSMVAMGVAKAAPAPAPEIDQFEIDLIAEMLAAGTVTVPGSLCFTSRPDGPPIVTRVSIPALGAMSVEDLVRTGLVTTRGLNRQVYKRMIEERPGNSGPWVSTLDARSKLSIVGRTLAKD